MDKCNLCQMNDADKKGSHIVPHFLLKRIENIDNKTGRDYEIGYKIGSLTSKSHFGRAVQPERLAETFGEITQKDIDNNQHPLVVDYFLCSDCEERLSEIESKYSQTIKTLDANNYESGISSSEGILFWASIFWRISVHGENGVRLTEEQNEVLRVLLDSFLPAKTVKLDEELLCGSDTGKRIAYKIIRCYNCDPQKGKWLLFHPDFFYSLCLYIDEFVVVMSLNGQFDELDKIDCFGINDLILDAPVNISGSKEMIKPFENTIFTEYTHKIVNRLRDVYADGLDDFFDKLHATLRGKDDKMPEEIKQQIKKEMASDEKKIGRKYTKEEIIKSTYTVMKKYRY
ncbi:hypothetical protein IWX83_003117 [Flavobacterium sp. CG_9.1]|uniref:hypothetical protein n=1 Tax=Flavobacterium sp. CG_9.1 TaxID=2787728 RepID=UPI0018CA7ABF|nr:hypothetical protein [Flavobacterium sp. CG_9.1]MBG6063307.1 hypothetical protein [Flavobacterium sp. CG_9.1]